MCPGQSNGLVHNCVRNDRSIKVGLIAGHPSFCFWIFWRQHFVSDYSTSPPLCFRHAPLDDAGNPKMLDMKTNEDGDREKIMTPPIPTKCFDYPQIFSKLSVLYQTPLHAMEKFGLGMIMRENSETHKTYVEERHPFAPLIGCGFNKFPPPKTHPQNCVQYFSVFAPTQFVFIPPNKFCYRFISSFPICF